MTSTVSGSTQSILILGAKCKIIIYSFISGCIFSFGLSSHVWRVFAGYWVIERNKWVFQTIISSKDKTSIRNWDECPRLNHRVSCYCRSVGCAPANSLHVSVVILSLFCCSYWPTYPPMDVRLPHELNVYQVRHKLWSRDCANPLPYMYFDSGLMCRIFSKSFILANTAVDG